MTCPECDGNGCGWCPFYDVLEGLPTGKFDSKLGLLKDAVMARINTYRNPAYTNDLDDDLGSLFTVKAFRDAVQAGGFNEHDGTGHPVKGGQYADIPVFVGGALYIPHNATHVIWFNK